LQRWQKGETGFHQDSLNPHLKYYYDDKAVPLEERKALKVFVPLCGKSLDMYWLSQLRETMKVGVASKYFGVIFLIFRRRIWKA
jgi:hypothetical protein